MLQNTKQKDDSNGNRADVTDQKPEDAKDLHIGAEGATVGELVVDVSLL